MSRNYKFHNPAENDLAIRPEGYIYSISRDYSGEKRLLDSVIDLDCSSGTTRKIRAAAAIEMVYGLLSINGFCSPSFS